jgi:hypothetical protein
MDDRQMSFISCTESQNSPQNSPKNNGTNLSKVDEEGEDANSDEEHKGTSKSADYGLDAPYHTPRLVRTLTDRKVIKISSGGVHNICIVEPFPSSLS